jgi:hypothetical protein
MPEIMTLTYLYAPYKGAGRAACEVIVAEYLQHMLFVQLLSDSISYLGSRCKSERCRTLIRFPLAFGTVAFAGFGLGNKPVILNGLVDGAGQKLELRELQIYLPSRPVTSARARTWVHIAPKFPVP